MFDGTHYGKIPGTKSISLYKAGAEKLMATFRLAAKPEVEDLSRDGEVHYRVTVNLQSAGGQFLGAGIGECSSREDKYAWRGMICQEEFDTTPENRRRIKFSNYQGRIEQKKQIRTNPSDVANTILKMAKKRAQVDAVITVTAASDIFTQDIEDLPDELREQVADDARSRARPGVQAAQRIVPEDTPERLKLIADMLAVADMGVEAFRKEWATMTKERRALVADRMDEFKARAEAAEAAALAKEAE
jgi:F0F1-type ATP synthase membrane subunit b/b'